MRREIAVTQAGLRGVNETGLITLYGRALQSRWPKPILSDPWAEEIVTRMPSDRSLRAVRFPEP